MKKLYAIALSFLPLLSLAQFTVEWHTPELQEGNPGQDIGFDYTLTNTDPVDTLYVTWRFTHDLGTTLGVWEDYMCEGIFVCWPSFKRFNTFALAPNESIDMYHHILTLNSNDTGTYTSTAYIFEAGDSANTVQEMTVTARIAKPDIPEGIANVDLSAASLMQNAPNPFKGSTLISYQLSSDQGRITFQDLTGKIVMETPLNQRSGSILVDGQLNAGIYFYTLWDNGSMVASKRMQVID